MKDRQVTRMEAPPPSHTGLTAPEPPLATDALIALAHANRRGN